MDMDEDDIPPVPPPVLVWTEEKKEQARRLLAPLLLSFMTAENVAAEDQDDADHAIESVNDMQANRDHPFWDRIYSPELLVQLNRMTTNNGLNSSPNARFNSRIPLAHVPWRKDKKAERLGVRAAETVGKIGLRRRALQEKIQRVSTNHARSLDYKPWMTLVGDLLEQAKADELRIQWHIDNGTITSSLLDEFDEVYNQDEYSSQDNEIHLLFLQARVKALERQVQEERENKRIRRMDDDDDNQSSSSGCLAQGKSKSRKWSTFKNISLCRQRLD